MLNADINLNSAIYNLQSAICNLQSVDLNAIAANFSTPATKEAGEKWRLDG